MSLLLTAAGRDLAESCRRMLARIGSNALWSLYSFKGKKGKQAFQNLSISRLLIRKSCTCIVVCVCVVSGVAYALSSSTLPVNLCPIAITCPQYRRTANYRFRPETTGNVF